MTQTANRILQALPADEFERLQPDLTRVDLKLGTIINRPYEPIPYVYFPENSMISVVASTPDGELAEAGVIGCEGLLGLAIVLGTDMTTHENMVQLPGSAYRMSSQALRTHFEEGGILRDLLLKFTYAHLTQLSQTALCNRLHLIDQRLARWILMAHDRAGADVLPLTQEVLAIMLGVQRPTVSGVAIELKKKGYINYSRGRLTVVARQKLEGLACECYEVVRDEYERVLF